ncbi:MAG: nucleotidyl transferase AbiEii/AbiGii toxin family protein [bacterium]
MSEPAHLAHLLQALRDVMNWMRAKSVKGIIIGGVAASLHGRPRVTRDVDAMVLLALENWGKFLTAGKQFGFSPRIDDPLDFARKTRVLLMRHQPSGIDIDISFGALPFEEESIARAVSFNVSDIKLLLPTPEDLIIMKAVAHRSRDLIDIAAVVEVQAKLDVRRIRRWVRDFSKAMEMPEILEDLERILARRKKRKY